MSKTILIKSKMDIVERVSNNTGISKKIAAAAVDEVFAEIAETLKDGGEISIYGFGKFLVRTRAARTGINPATQEMIDYQGRKVPRFKPSKTLKDAVRKNT